MKKGTVVINKVDIKGNPPGTLGVICERGDESHVMALVFTPDSCCVIFANGAIDWFSPQEQKDKLHEVGFEPECAGYEFAGIAKINDDYQNRFWDFKKLFEKFVVALITPDMQEKAMFMAQRWEKLTEQQKDIVRNKFHSALVNESKLPTAIFNQWLSVEMVVSLSNEKQDPGLPEIFFARIAAYYFIKKPMKIGTDNSMIVDEETTEYEIQLNFTEMEFIESNQFLDTVSFNNEQAKLGKTVESNINPYEPKTDSDEKQL